MTRQNNLLFRLLFVSAARRSAFSVALADKSTYCLKANNGDKTIVYKNILLNLGRDYDENTGIYTVPFSGVYSLAVTVFNDAGFASESVNILSSLRVNNQVVATAKDINTDDHEDSATMVLAFRLNASDTLDVMLHSGHRLCGGLFNTFSGFLLYKD